MKRGEFDYITDSLRGTHSSLHISFGIKAHKV